MNDYFTTLLIQIATSSTAEQTAETALHAFVDLIQPQWACLLMWDQQLGRCIVGDTWLHSSSSLQLAAVRRLSLQMVEKIQEELRYQISEVQAGYYYIPLYTPTRYVGAFVYQCPDSMPTPTGERYEMLRQVASHALYTTTRLQEADQDRIQLEGERQRLEHLLLAVEQQQQTIDELLMTEKQLSASLELKVEERTTALKAAQIRLIQSEKLAIIGQLAGSLAHELNNPLQAIQSGLGLVMDEIDQANSELVRQDVTIIQQELERIQSIFRQMLDFYRPATHEHVPLDLNAICEGVRVLMRKRLQETNVALHVQLTPDLPLTCGDSNQIKQVLLNLLLNAAEAMPAAGGNVWLQTETHESEVSISVIDDGHGIPVEYQSRLFEPLFTTKTRGMGLGLAISQDIIQRHAGLISVQSASGTRTMFKVKLPARSACHDNS